MSWSSVAKTDPRSPVVRLLALAVLLLLFLASAYYSTQYSQNVDKFYHFAISQRVLQEWIPERIPSVDLLGWDVAFAEKEFLFHQGTALGYFLGQETGVRVFCFLLSIGILVQLFYFAAARLPLSLTSLLMLVLILGSPYFVFRLQLIRPHLAGICFFLLGFIAVLERRVLLASLAAGLFSLSYHVFYLPLAVFGITALGAQLAGDGPMRKASMFAILGLVLGLLLNPYFPQSVEIAFDHLMMALSPPADIPAYFVGSELLKPQWTQILSEFWVHLLAVVLCFLALAVRFCRADRSEQALAGTRQLEFLILFTLTVFLFALGKANPRSFEYAIPLSLLCLASGLSLLGALRTAVCLLLLFGALSGPKAYRAYTQEESVVAKRVHGGLAALASVSQSELRGKRVFNCHWDMGSLLLYQHPEAHIIDLLDPRLLYFHDFKLARLRLALFEGRVKQPDEVIRSIFKADYILCHTRGLHQALEQSGIYQRVYPKGDAFAAPRYTPGLQPALYRLR